MDIVIMGEMLVEIMRDSVGVPLDKAGTFKGPYPSGAPRGRGTASYDECKERGGSCRKMFPAAEYGNCCIEAWF